MLSPTARFAVMVIKDRIKADEINSVRVVGKELVETFTSNEEGMCVIFGEIGFECVFQVINDLCGVV